MDKKEPIINSPQGNYNRTDTGISKLKGCFTRWYEYRWEIFSPFLENLSPKSSVLDIGCGSLMETYNLSQFGFSVTGIDFHAELLEKYRLQYNWNGIPEPTLIAENLLDYCQKGNTFDLVTAFDVIEHIHELEKTLDAIYTSLKPGGLLFATIPNKWASTELFSRILGKLLKLVGHQSPPGVGHVQFKSVSEWKQTLTNFGFEILDWQMVIGPIANTSFFLITTPAQLILSGLELAKLCKRSTRHRLMHSLLYTKKLKPLARFCNAGDVLFHAKLKNLYTWNILVARRP